jgi:N-acetylmuramic acid 6-phosphate etherase
MPREPLTARDRARQFLQVAPDFSLGSLPTESSHPRTADLSDTARHRTEDGLAALLGVDRDVVRKYAEWSATDEPARMAGAALDTLRRGGRLFFTGCGATGRLSIQLDSIWRAFWQDRRARRILEPAPDCWEDRTRSVMAGGDYALIKAVEGFEDFAPFGRRQIMDLGLAPGDTVFAISEGGETPFVIGTAWQGVETGARVFFVYNNPDAVLKAHVRRSREVIEDPRIEKINLATGPMAITGSTRMQATSIELLALATVLEMVLRDLVGAGGRLDAGVAGPADVGEEMRAGLRELHAALAADRTLGPLARLVEAEERTYRAGGRTSYFARALGVDVLTDTTERSPTFCTPSFRKRGDEVASESWAFLFVPVADTESAWPALLRREPRTIEWTDDVLRSLLDEEAAARQAAVLKEIGHAELMRFRIGLDGTADRPLRPGDGVIAVASTADLPLLQANAAFERALASAAGHGADGGLIVVGSPETVDAATASPAAGAASHVVSLAVPAAPSLLDTLSRIGVKMLLNALSTCTMVRLGRVVGNRMIWVVPSNLKLIDRSIRYIRDLAGVTYEDACFALFDVIDYIEPRRSAGQAYPPPVGLALIHLRDAVSLEEAERRVPQLQGAARDARRTD